jgi:FAD dependent monooxygenase
MTPNIGQGGNAAIESAATLSNSLKRLISNASFAQPSLKEVKHSLQAFQQIRQTRAKKVFEVSNMMTRVEALKGFPEKIMALYGSPYTGDWVPNLSAQSK